MSVGTRTEYDSAAMILRTVWFAEPHLDDESRSIDWLAIDHASEKFHPSDGEGILLGIALAFWTGRGGPPIMDIVRWLDRNNLAVFIEALRLRSGM